MGGQNTEIGKSASPKKESTVKKDEVSSTKIAVVKTEEVGNGENTKIATVATTGVVIPVADQGKTGCCTIF